MATEKGAISVSEKVLGGRRQHLSDGKMVGDGSPRHVEITNQEEQMGGVSEEAEMACSDKIIEFSGSRRSNPEGFIPEVSCNFFPLFSLHPSEESWNKIKQSRKGQRGLYFNPNLQKSFNEDLLKQCQIWSCPSLVTQLCYMTLTQALCRKDLGKKLRKRINVESISVNDPDQPPTPRLSDKVDRLECSFQLTRPTQILLLYTHFSLDKWKTVSAVKSHCFRILRSLNTCIPLWGSHHNSFFWHSQHILNATSLKSLANYILVFDEILENLILTWHEVEELNRQPYESGRTENQRKTRNLAKTTKADSVIQHGPPSVYDPGFSSDNPVFDNCKTFLNGSVSTSMRKNDSESFEYSSLKWIEHKGTASNVLLSCLMYRIDGEFLYRCLISLEYYRQKLDSSYSVFTGFDEALKSFAQGQAFHYVHQSLSQCLNNNPVQLKSFSNASSSCSTRRGRRRFIDTQNLALDASSSVTSTKNPLENIHVNAILSRDKISSAAAKENDSFLIKKNVPPPTSLPEIDQVHANSSLECQEELDDVNRQRLRDTKRLKV